MLSPKLLTSAGLFCAFAAPAFAQHSQTDSVAVDPSNPNRVWVCNRDNNSVSVVDVSTQSVVAEIPVGVWPRTLDFSADGTKVFVANQRGNVPLDASFVTPFTGSEIRGSVSVINTASLLVTNTLTQVGTEPYGLAVAPNGKYFAVSGHRSGTVKLYDASTLTLLATHQYLNNLDFLPVGKTIADADSNKDFLADLGEPRGFTIQADNQHIYVTHSTSPFVSVLNVSLDVNGLPTAVALESKIGLNDYPFDIFFNPVPVQTIESQGLPRFLEDIALSPDGTRALVPHLLHNINHDVNHDFGPGLAGAFANRVYPALTVLDAANKSFGQLGDNSARLEHELNDPAQPAQFVSYGGQGTATSVGIATLGGEGSPTLGGTLNWKLSGGKPGDLAWVWVGSQTSLPLPPYGTLLASPDLLLTMTNRAGTFSRSLPIPNDPSLDGAIAASQAVILELPSFGIALSNGLKIVLDTVGFGSGNLGYRAAHPSRALYSPDGSNALLLNRGSEDVFLYSVSGSSLELRNVFPPRVGFVERAPLDNNSPLGDLPLGMALVSDPTTSNNDALLYVINEGNRTLSSLRIDWTTGVITQEAAQIPTHLGVDIFTNSELIGQEVFEDASRAQTTGNFNNSCGSCHFEGNADGNVWQRPAGPRSTMPTYGGSLATGLLLWKGVRLNMGETGPMFGGENGGTGVFSDAEQQGMDDYHAKQPVPLNPNLDPVTGALTAQAAFGRDLFFGLNDTGLNPALRRAGCATCHPNQDTISGNVRGFTMDFLDPVLTSGENFESVDPLCFSLQENIVSINLRDINSAVNLDEDNDGFPDIDRNLDGYSDVETYAPMNPEKNDDFTRDDNNSYSCPEDPFGNPSGPQKLFARNARLFSIPTKLGVFSTGPYFHDHSASSLRMILDPAAQTSDPKYGDPSYPGLQKYFNEFHDIRGHQEFVPSVSKVQVTLNTPPGQANADIDALLAWIQSL